jgi:hypothetical protein
MLYLPEETYKMNFTMKKIAATVILATAAMSAQAAPDALLNTSNFQMFDPTGAFVGGAAAPTLTGFIDTVAGTWNVASTTPFFGLNWTASGGTLYGVGTHTVNVNGDGALGAGVGDVTFTVGAGQVGGNINFAWGATTGIDVFNVWNVTTAGGITTYTSTNFNALYNGVAVAPDAILGFGMVDGPFPGFSANFNMTTAVPEASTYGMMLAGLGLIGGMVSRRRKTMG